MKNPKCKCYETLIGSELRWHVKRDKDFNLECYWLTCEACGRISKRFKNPKDVTNWWEKSNEPESV